MKRNICGRIITLFLIFVLVFCFSGNQNSYAIDLTNSAIPGLTDINCVGTLPELTAASAILIDAETGQILYQKYENQASYPASTTKIMTALLAIENLNMEDTVVVDAEAAKMTGSKMYISEGEEISVKDLLYGLMLSSANDAAVALAKTVCPTTSEFVALMNEKAVACGTKNTHFNNTNGLPDAQHYTTAYDLAMITKAAFAHQSFRDLVATVTYTIPATNMYEARELINSNKMLWSTKTIYDIDGVPTVTKYEGANGVKTGFTNDAGSCLVESVNRDGHELIGVVLGCEPEQHYPDMIKLMNYGFQNYNKVVLCAASDYQYEIKVKKSKQKRITVGLANDISVTLPKSNQENENEVKQSTVSSVETKDITMDYVVFGTKNRDSGEAQDVAYNSKVTTKVNLEEKYEAPIAENQEIGSLNVYYDGNLICVAPLVATQAAPLRNGPDWGLIGICALIFVGVLLLLLIILRIIFKVKRSQRRKQRNNM